MKWIINNLLWSQGTTLVVVISLFALIGIRFRIFLLFSSLFFCFSLYFFRNPERACLRAQNDSSIIISPADGKIVDVQYNAEGIFRHYTHKISIFLSPFDVHVNRIPASGVVQEVVYSKGEFRAAFLPKSSLFNEHNDVEIKTEGGHLILVRQIAGMIARRIVCWVAPGDRVAIGTTYGMIKFGSRVDVFLPDTVKLNISLHDRVYAGQTVLGRWK